MVVGTSPDTPGAMKKFKEQFQLPFLLLSDKEKTLAKSFGVLKEKNMYGKKVMGIERSTFVIGPEGKVEHEFRGVKPAGHAEEVLASLKSH